MPRNGGPEGDDAGTKPPSLRELIWSDYAIRTDVHAVLSEVGHVSPDRRDAGSRIRAPIRFLLSPSLRAALLFRLNARSGPRTYWFWRSLLLTLHSSEVMRGATIGPGLRLPHPYGIGIGNRVVIGENVTIAHHVTLGSDKAWSGQPKVGDGVTVHTGAVIAGPIEIGAGAVIGANCVVLENVEAGGLAAVARTRITRRRVNWEKSAERG